MIAMNSWKECFRSVAKYAEKLLLQHERKNEQKMKVSSSFSGFSPSMPVSLEQLSFADLGMITTSASSSAVCAGWYVCHLCAFYVTPGLLVPELPQKRRRVTHPRERELMLANFKDWWASRRSMPWSGPSSELQPPLVIPSVVLVSGLSSALAIPAIVAPSAP